MTPDQPDANDATSEIARQAALWLVNNRDNPDAEERRAFGTWLRASPAHAQAYADALRLQSTLHRALPSPVPSVEEIVASARAASRPAAIPVAQQARARPLWSRRWAYAAAAATIPVVAALSLWKYSHHLPAANDVTEEEHYATTHGQQLAPMLPDGSLLHLNTDTAVTVRYARAARWVEIERGQVAFKVAHDASRPFRVVAGSAQVTAVGTEFDVYLQGETTLVTVVEGRVAVGPSAGNARPLLVGAAEQVRVRRGELPPAPTPVDPARATAWLQRQISFHHEPLSQVATEFNRYAATPIDIETPALRELPVSGVFNVDDTDSMVAFLRSLAGVKVEVTPGRIRVFEN